AFNFARSAGSSLPAGTRAKLTHLTSATLSAVGATKPLVSASGTPRDLSHSAAPSCISARVGAASSGSAARATKGNRRKADTGGQAPALWVGTLAPRRAVP